MNTRLFRLAACLPLLGLAPAQAGVVPIDPFVGERSDPLDYPNTIIVASFPIFGNTASLDSHNGQTFIHYLLSDTFIGDVVTPRTGGHILGFTEGPGIFRFNEPVRRFGMYFNNNSGTDDTTCDFYDAEGNLLASLTATTPCLTAMPTGVRSAAFGTWSSSPESNSIPSPATGRPSTQSVRRSSTLAKST